MMKSLNLLIPAAIVAGAVALALYAMPRTYQIYMPQKAVAETYSATSGDAIPTGRIAGRIVWEGALPEAPPVEGMIGGAVHGPLWSTIPNPAAPSIHPTNRGIANAVVHLKSVGPNAKRWTYLPLSVEMRERNIGLIQGDIPTQLGFVRLGDDVNFVPRDAWYQMVRVRGADFFTSPLWNPLALPALALAGGIATPALPPPNADRIVKRKFDHSGHIAINSGTGYFWNGADAFVCEHPYYSLTDAEGRFELTHVPPGEYEIVAWLKNWNILSKDRDPETGKIMRLNFNKPFTTTGRVNVIEGQTANVELSLP